jgi:hypothetical protein
MLQLGKPKFNLYCIKKSVPTSESALRISLIITNHVIVFRAVMAAYKENCIE